MATPQPGQGQYPDKVTMRLPPGSKDRVESCAEFLNMPAGELLRELVLLGLEAQEERQQQIANGVIDVFEPEAEVDAGPEEPQVTDPDYAEKVAEAAAEIRDQERTFFDRDKPDERINPRDCVHPPNRRNGPVCTRCGFNLGRRIGGGNISRTGRYIGRQR